MEIKLIFLGISGPCYFFKAVGFGMDEFCVLRNWLIWVTKKERSNYENKFILFTFLMEIVLG